mmetsp:Transcript_14735/g.36745  ORF Transcript_14735/g.36745 Transcript_14735/m.36745 type:complete len:387 (-) Transcript_14735:193-1353(-)
MRLLHRRQLGNDGISSADEEEPHGLGSRSKWSNNGAPYRGVHASGSTTPAPPPAHGHDRAPAPSATVLAVVVLVIFCCAEGSPDPPGWLLKPLAMTGLVYLGLKLLTFKRWGDEHRAVPRFLACFLAMLVELSVENGMVWLVSASDTRKYDNVPGLQDNVELAIRWAGQQHPRLWWAARAKWVNTKHFLGALLALAFSPLWDQVPFSGFGLMSRAVLTIAASRVLRMACFMCTVLPNPQPGCYARRFPPVPATAWETIKAGYTTIRGFGGCNDLIFSGHAAFWVLAPLALQSYAPRPRWAVGLLWIALVQACIRDVVDRQHYSVDMLLAVVVTWGVWNALAWVYPHTQPLPRRKPGAAADKPHPLVLGLIAACLLVAGVIVIGGKA